MTPDVFMYMLWLNFILGLHFIFLHFGGMVMYDNEFETIRKIKFQPKIKIINHNIY